jgi:hypothetical protein
MRSKHDHPLGAVQPYKVHCGPNNDYYIDMYTAGQEMSGWRACKGGLLSTEGGGVDAQQPAIGGHFVAHAKGDDVTRHQLLNWVVVNFYSITQHTAYHTMFGAYSTGTAECTTAILTSVPSHSTNR